MSMILAIMFAQSLWGDLTGAGKTEVNTPEPVAAEVAPETAATEEADPVEPAPAEEAGEEAQPQEAPATTEEPPAAEPEAEEPAQTGEPKAEEPKAGPENKSEPSPKGGVSRKIPSGPRSVKITSDRTDYDRREGVIMFDRNVFVDDEEYKMHSDQLYVFLDGTNELKRIVAIGNVAITNETRVGSCVKAAYTKSIGKVVMYGDGEVKAKLADNGKRKSELEGRKITFWIDSEQVEVEGSAVTLDAGGFNGKEGAKKLLGK